MIRRVCQVVTAATVIAGACGPGAGRPLIEVITEDGRMVWRAPIALGEPFDVAFTHSHERCRWTHHYRAVDRDRIEQRASTFPCVGAGMPLSTAGEAVRTPAGYTVVQRMELEALPMMNWRDARITLGYRGDDIPVGSLMGDFVRFQIRIR